jgi:hypothetical protein
LARVRSDSARTVLCFRTSLLTRPSFVIGFDGGGGRLLVQPLGVEPGLQAGEVGLGGAQLVLGFELLLLQLRIGELEDDGVGRHLRAGPQDDALDAALRRRGQPAPRLVDRHQRAETAHLAQHRAALHRVDPHGGAFHRRRGRLEARQHDRDAGHRQHGRHADEDPLPLLLLGHGGRALDIHELVSLLRRARPPEGWHRRSVLTQTTYHAGVCREPTDRTRVGPSEFLQPPSGRCPPVGRPARARNAVVHPGDQPLAASR